MNGQTPRELEGLSIAVLGSTSGIGRATALELARAGADVIVHGKSSLERAIEVASLIRRMDRRAEVMMADLGNRHQAKDFVDQAWSTFDGLDGWVQIAGADTLTGSAAKLDFESKLDLLWNVDVAGTMICCRRVGQLMRDQGHGAIVTMGWDQAESGMEGDSGELFSTTKGAVHAFTKSLSRSLAPSVRVNAVAPGWIQTAWGESAPPIWQQRVLDETPLKRWGTPEDLAAAIRYLVGPAASFVTGQVLMVNGGAVRR